jgi:EAL domain-containing protein (putative c-di-GMP-specific phosphodiesterase class I)
MRDRVTTRMQMEQELRVALREEQLEVHYQPRVELAGATIRGFEALVRWRHPVRGLVPPDAFIGVAEETGQIQEIGLWVLRRACLQLKEWQAAFPQTGRLSVAVNVSAVQCRKLAFVADVDKVLRETGVEPADLQLELTESVLMESLETAQRILTGLRQLGVVLKLDDFGTGYSSLQYLARLPFDMLKIDRSFVAALNRPGNPQELIRTILEMAHNLNMQVVAEGVETPEHSRLLHQMGCEFGQGYYFSKPLPVAAIEDLLRGEGAIPRAAQKEGERV